MKIFYLFSSFLILTGCASNKYRDLDNLDAVKKDFIHSISESCIDEGPFQMNYNLRTILFSKNIISLFGEASVYDHLPHGWSKLESKTYVKNNGKFKEVTLNDLFPLPTQKEFLRKFCENFLKTTCYQGNYFTGPEPLNNFLDMAYINLFVIDHESLIILFQPYTVGGLGDEPFFVKIPFTELIGQWQTGNPIEKQLPITKNFISSWDTEKWISDIQENHSISK